MFTSSVRRAGAVFAFLVLGCALSARLPAGESLLLMTRDEYRQTVEKAGDVEKKLQGPRDRGQSVEEQNAPEIRIVLPHMEGNGDLKGTVSSPLDIQVLWSARLGADIDVSSLRFYVYKVLGYVNVTGKVREWVGTTAGAKLDAHELYIPNVAFDADKIMAKLAIADTQGRLRSQVFVLTITKK